MGDRIDHTLEGFALKWSKEMRQLLEGDMRKWEDVGSFSMYAF